MRVVLCTLTAQDDDLEDLLKRFEGGSAGHKVGFEFRGLMVLQDYGLVVI